MTAELVFRELKEGRLHLDDTFHVSEHAWRTGGAHAHATATFLDVNSNVRIEDLLRGLIVQSGNDAAIVLAEGMAGSEEAFADRMNKRAAELGLAHSNFVDPWGRDDPAQKVTARDMARLAAYVIREYPDDYHYFGEKEFTWNKIRQLNRNPLLGAEPGADGLKTGEAPESGFSLVGSAAQDGQRLIVVVAGLKTAPERGEEARKLLEWGFHAFEPRLLFQPGEVVGTASVFGGASSEVPLTCDAADQGVSDPRGPGAVDGEDRLPRAAGGAGRRRRPGGDAQSVARRHARARSAAAHADGDPARRPRQAGVRRRRRVRHRPHPRRAGEELMARAPAPGRFITLEGGEGAGKSVQARRLAARLGEAGLSVVLTREPGGSPGAEALREVILSGGAARYGAIGEAILFSAARIDHIDATIAPALKRGEWVVSDRFLDSTRAYQGAAGQLDPDLVASLERVAVGACRPDLTLVLDLPAAEGLARATARRGEAAADRFEGEGLAFHETLRRAFLAIVEAEPERCALIDARPGEGEVAAAIWAAVRARLGEALNAATAAKR